VTGDAAWDRFAADWPQSAAIAQMRWDVARCLERQGIVIAAEDGFCAEDGSPALRAVSGDTLIIVAVAGSEDEAKAGMTIERLQYLRDQAAAWAQRIMTAPVHSGTALGEVSRYLRRGLIACLRVDAAHAAEVGGGVMLTWSKAAGGLVPLHPGATA
jgi:hypothetical protein